ncbi:MAG: NAD-dependent epimerase/dehydratase family protein [Methanosarcinaceae archaeon]
MFNKKNVLVTGGAGFVGTNLIKRLLDLGANVRVTLHKKQPQIRNEDIEFVQCDLQRPEDCAKVCENMDYVFLCAAETAGAGMMEKKPLFLLTPNLMMNALMLEAAYGAKLEKILFISSNTVYPVTDYPVKEEDVNYDFFEKYFIAGWMKRFCETICEMYSTKIKKPMKTVVVRPANIYGPFDDFEWETSHVLPAMIRRVVERHEPIEVWGDGKDIKDFIFIEDFIEGMLLAMEKIETFDIVNIASGNQYVLKDILNTIIRTDGYKNAEIIYDASKPTMIPKRLIDPSKAKRTLGFEAKTPIEEGIKKTIEWYRSVL